MTGEDRCRQVPNHIDGTSMVFQPRRWHIDQVGRGVAAAAGGQCGPAGPASRCRVQDAPESGPRPTRANAISTLAPRAASRRSQANASDAPAPAATPFTAAITGLGIRATAVMIGL